MNKSILLLIIAMLMLITSTGFAQPAKVRPINMVFVGDILLDGYVGSQIKKHGTKYPFLKVAPILQKADIAFGNLETPVSIRGSKASKTFAFRSEPKTLDGLVYAGIDGVSLANNHILDYGKEAMLDTLIHLDRKSIGHTGAGKDIDEAFQPYIHKVHGQKIAIVGINHILVGESWIATKTKPGAASAFTDQPLLSYVKKISSANDFTIVYIHWNSEFKYTPEDYAPTLARKMIDNGVDMIIGAHSHTLMGVEFYKHKPIYYSLGNFVFNQSTRGGPKTTLSLILSVSLNQGRVVSKAIPVKIVQGQPRLMDKKFNAAMITHLNKYSYNTKISADGLITEK